MNEVKLKDQIGYWDIYYKNHNVPLEPTSFAKYCLPLIKKKSNFLELGCGNGRDSIFFAKNNISVLASDISKTAIENLKKTVPVGVMKNLKLLNEDFTNFEEEKFTEHFDTIYSRFTLHTILKNKLDKVLNWSFKSLHSDGLILIETRSTKDPLFSSGTGKLIDKNTFLYEEGHLRHFIDRGELVKKIMNTGFSLEEVTESNNLSILGNDNPCLLRVIARKITRKRIQKI